MSKTGMTYLLTRGHLSEYYGKSVILCGEQHSNPMLFHGPFKILAQLFAVGEFQSLAGGNMVTAINILTERGYHYLSCVVQLASKEEKVILELALIVLPSFILCVQK